MNRIFCLLACVSLTAGDLKQLRELFDNDRFFELRRALQQPGWDDSETLFYRGALACRFGRDADGVELLRRFLQTQRDSEIAYQAYEEMCPALIRLGRYREYVEARDAALRLTAPENRDENTRNLVASFIDVPPVTAEIGQASPVKARRNRGGGWNVPVELNGTPAELDFDTGANFSMISESDAKRMGLSIMDSTSHLNGGSGGQPNVRVAVAHDLRIGAAHIHNVVFLVLADQALYVAPLHTSIPAIMGIPVMRALGRIGIAGDGTLRMEQPHTRSIRGPNLFFDGLQPVVEVTHQQHPLQLFLDTGGSSSALFPSVRQTLTPQEAARMRTAREKWVGIGGQIATQKIERLHHLELRVFDTPVELTKADFFTTRPNSDPRYRDGVLGLDALRSGFEMDFQTMTFTVNEPN